MWSIWVTGGGGGEGAGSSKFRSDKVKRVTMCEVTSMKAEVRLDKDQQLCTLCSQHYNNDCTVSRCVWQPLGGRTESLKPVFTGNTVLNANLTLQHAVLGRWITLPSHRDKCFPLYTKMPLEPQALNNTSQTQCCVPPAQAAPATRRPITTHPPGTTNTAMPNTHPSDFRQCCRAAWRHTHRTASKEHGTNRHLPSSEQVKRLLASVVVPGTCSNDSAAARMKCSLLQHNDTH
ncbi:hypothetical protein E2C01_038114 [Portunus trituberculatus]|uniref:Uncharacterized protein n=1 Tax=Portunus trituberculatus TaxID=210409 RepID=A0A5B7FBC6_PORTR|nr:hypothetical protein [Portunus trituberculatus]